MFECKVIEYKGKKRITVAFSYEPAVIQEIRKIRGATWSRSLRVWHVPDNKTNRLRFGLPELEAEQYSPNFLSKLEHFWQWLHSKRYGESTIKIYTETVKVFFHFYKHKSIEVITAEDVIHFNNVYILKKKLSISYQNQFVNSLRLFYKTVEHQKLDFELVHRPKQAKVLPNVLSKEEVKCIIEAPTNIKHRMMLSLIYACGLRRSELLNLFIIDIHSDRGVIVIRQSKGKKDRIVPIGEKLLNELRAYYKIYRPKKWLFEGQETGQKYSPKSLQNVLKSSLSKTTISKPVTLHWLRHSYATHLLENGTDLRYIQELLGHNSSKTTEIYTHVCSHQIQKIVSPFDLL